jgi:hypothetical protein
MIHDRPHHLAQRRITYLLRRALGDLFLGPYSVYMALRAPGTLANGPADCLTVD